MLTIVFGLVTLGCFVSMGIILAQVIKLARALDRIEAQNAELRAQLADAKEIAVPNWVVRRPERFSVRTPYIED